MTVCVSKWQMTSRWSPCRIYVTSVAQEGGARALPAAWRRQTYVAAKSRGQKSLFIEGQRERERGDAVQSRDQGKHTPL